MPRYLLHHHHTARECGVAFASWKGFTSALRHHSALATCLTGGHAIWWTIEAPDPDAALAQLPPFVAQRTTAVRVGEVEIP
jgi:hypothetical protein